MYKPTISESQIPKQGFQLIKNTQKVELSFQNYAAQNHTRMLTIKNQIIPLGVDNKSFAGYPTIFHAYFVIEKINSTNIFIIYQTEFDPLVPATSNQNWFGRFYVYACINKAFKVGNPTITILPFELPKGVIQGNVINMSPNPRKSFQSDIDQVYKRFLLVIDKGKKPFDVDGKRSHLLYKQALTSTPYFTDKDFESTSSQIPSDPSYGYLNSSLIHILNATKFGSVTKVDSSGRVVSEYTSREEFYVFDSQKLFDYSISITEDSLTRTLAQNLITFAHEGIHVLQGYRGNYVLKKWRSQKKIMDLAQWIEIEARKPNSEIGLIDIIYALRNYSPKESTQQTLKKSTELESYLNTFILALSFSSSSNLYELLSYLDSAAIFYVESDPTNRWTRMMFNKYAMGILLTYVELRGNTQKILLREIKKRANNSDTQTLYTWIFEIVGGVIIVNGKNRKK